MQGPVTHKCAARQRLLRRIIERKAKVLAPINGRKLLRSTATVRRLLRVIGLTDRAQRERYAGWLQAVRASRVAVWRGRLAKEVSH